MEYVFHVTSHESVIISILQNKWSNILAASGSLSLKRNVFERKCEVSKTFSGTVCLISKADVSTTDPFRTCSHAVITITCHRMLNSLWNMSCLWLPLSLPVFWLSMLLNSCFHAKVHWKNSHCSRLIIGYLQGLPYKKPETTGILETSDTWVTYEWEEKYQV